jgi:hypothetical protein
VKPAVVGIGGVNAAMEAHAAVVAQLTHEAPGAGPGRDAVALDPEDARQRRR